MAYKFDVRVFVKRGLQRREKYEESESVLIGFRLAEKSEKRRDQAVFSE
jgi:hypothetical protein